MIRFKILIMTKNFHARYNTITEQNNKGVKKPIIYTNTPSSPNGGNNSNNEEGKTPQFPKVSEIIKDITKTLVENTLKNNKQILAKIFWSSEAGTWRGKYKYHRVYDVTRDQMGIWHKFNQESEMRYRHESKMGRNIRIAILTPDVTGVAFSKENVDPMTTPQKADEPNVEDAFPLWGSINDGITEIRDIRQVVFQEGDWNTATVKK